MDISRRKFGTLCGVCISGTAGCLTNSSDDTTITGEVGVRRLLGVTADGGHGTILSAGEDGIEGFALPDGVDTDELDPALEAEDLPMSELHEEFERLEAEIGIELATDDPENDLEANDHGTYLTYFDVFTAVRVGQNYEFVVSNDSDRFLLEAVSE